MASMSFGILLGGLLALGFGSAAHAQGTIQNSYNAPTWGQNGATPWGTQSGTVSQGAWPSTGAPQGTPPPPNSSYPNANSQPFGSTRGNTNPLTSRGRVF